MSTTNRTVEALEKALESAQPHQLLSAFVVRFNDLSGQLDEVSQERDELDIQLAALGSAQAAHLARIDDLERQNASLREAALRVNQLVGQVNTLNLAHNNLQAQLSAAQQVISAAGGVNGISKLREQVKRLKDGNAEKDARISQLERDNSKARHDLTTAQRQSIEAHTKIDLLQRQLAHDTGSGLYHNGEHHLIIWPQKTKFQRPDGTTFESRSLLYMHQSGRGALFTYSEESGTVFAASPKPGLKPTKEVQEFAHNWLFKVNSLQGGIVHESDMVPVDFNGYATEQGRAAA
jgi:outer membrane murein-binding lipoprotein Lpp